MKRILIPSVICFLVVFWGQVKAAEKELTVSKVIVTGDSLMDNERIDTPLCSELIKMKPNGGDSWFFSSKYWYSLKGTGIPRLKIRMQKNTPDANTDDNLIMVFVIDSVACIDKGCRITLTYDDNSNAVFENFNPNNCGGRAGISFEAETNDKQHKVADPKLKKLRKSKITGIKIEAHSGVFNYVLTDIEITNLQYRINCLHNAK